MSFFYRLDTIVYYSNSRYIGLITNRHPAAQTGFGYNTTNRKARQFYQNYRAIMAEAVGFEPTVPFTGLLDFESRPL